MTMPADDSLLSQGTVDARNEERNWRNQVETCPAATPVSAGSPREEGRPNTSLQAGTVAGLHPDLLPASPLFCLRDPRCEAVLHLEDCPVEIALKEEFGY